MKCDVIDLANKKTGSINLDEGIFDGFHVVCVVDYGFQPSNYATFLVFKTFLILFFSPDSRFTLANALSAVFLACIPSFG